MGIEGGTIDLKTSEPRSVTRAKFHTIIKRLIGIARTPQSQSLFREMMMSKMMGQAENARHIATAHLGGGLADFAVKLRCFFDNEHPRIGPATFQNQSGRGARKRATDDCHIVIHGEDNEERPRWERHFRPMPDGEEPPRTVHVSCSVRLCSPV